jgi:hypothetical protein
MADPVVHLTNGIPDSGTGNVTTLGQLIDPTNGPAAIKAASTAPVASDKSIVVAISPNGQNANLNVDPNTGVAGHFGAPVAALDYYSQYKGVAASQTATVLGATGAQYDYISHILVVPASLSPGNILIRDGNGSDITVFAGGASSIADLKSFIIPLGATALAGTTGGWRVTTGANVSVMCFGRFT